VLVFNGKIYNYQALKATISFEWQTSSDTELLMGWLKAFGRSRLDELEGMIAFYDTQNNTCLLARNRFWLKTPKLSFGIGDLKLSIVILLVFTFLRPTSQFIFSFRRYDNFIRFYTYQMKV